MYARDGGSPPLLAHVTVRVAVDDENDHAPAFGSAHLSLEVPEGQDPQTLATLRASDPDAGANGQLQYRILGESLPTCLGLSAPHTGLCPTQCVWSLPSLCFALFLSCVCVSVSLHLQFLLSLCLCFCLSVSFFFSPISLCRAVILRLLWSQKPLTFLILENCKEFWLM